MATATLIPVDEYLNTTYRPDCDYLDGEIKERTLGEQPHAKLQIALGALFYQNRNLWQIRPLTEQRVQVTPTRYRIPDLCLLRRTDPTDPIVRVPPLLCIEILSSSDSLRELQERVNDYAAMGVPHIWAIDPWQRAAYYASPQGFQKPIDGLLRLPNSLIAVQLDTLFADLDEL